MKKYGLIGKSLSHSFSKKYFNSFFSENNIDAVYDEFEIPEIEHITKVLNVMKGHYSNLERQWQTTGTVGQKATRLTSLRSF